MDHYDYIFNKMADPYLDPIIEYYHSITSQIPALHTYTPFSATTLCILSIAFNPIFWNIAARLEHRTHIGSKLLGPRLGCYSLAITIFSLGLLRDHLYLAALAESSTSLNLLHLPHRELGSALFGLGNMLVVSSMYALGVTGTYLGDYFGILMSERVTGFPFNVTDNPMYWGSTISFLGTALWYAKPLGVWLTLEVWLMYTIALVSLLGPVQVNLKDWRADGCRNSRNLIQLRYTPNEIVSASKMAGRSSEFRWRYVRSRVSWVSSSDMRHGLLEQGPWKGGSAAVLDGSFNSCTTRTHSGVTFIDTKEKDTRIYKDVVHLNASIDALLRSSRFIRFSASII